MQETKLPNKKDWARQLNDTRKANKITKGTLSEKCDFSRVTLNRILDCDGTFDQMKHVENVLRSII